ncbi:MAG: hypothetical protein WCB31_10030 [Nitrososphaeraceae archaeon]
MSAVKENAIISIENALVTHKNIIPQDVVIGTDNGSQFTSKGFRKSVSVLWPILVDFLIFVLNFAILNRAFLNIDISIRGVIKQLSCKYKSIRGVIKQLSCKYKSIRGVIKQLSCKYKSFKKDKDDLNKYIAKKFKMEIDDVDGKEQQS